LLCDTASGVTPLITMTLELNQVAPQVKALGQSLTGQAHLRSEAKIKMQALLRDYSTAFTELHERVVRAEKVQQQQRFDWVGAAPTNEALAESYPLPPRPERATVIASDGSQILPDPHAIALYYLINVGSIVYRHGSNLKPETYNPKPNLYYDPADLMDEQGRLISLGEVNVKRDMAEIEVLTELAPRYTEANEPVIALMDGQFILRVIDLPFQQQQEYQQLYLSQLDLLRDSGALVAAYIDRPRSTFVVALMLLASLELAAINENSLRSNEFRHLTDLDLFDFLGPGERSAIFSLKAKGLDRYSHAGHGVHFFFLNVSAHPSRLSLARVEIPAWMVANPRWVEALHATLVRQARLTGGYPYVLARAHELAIISNEERQAVEMMLALEMRRYGLDPAPSAKQFNKNLLTEREGFAVKIRN